MFFYNVNAVFKIISLIDSVSSSFIRPINNEALANILISETGGRRRRIRPATRTNKRAAGRDGVGFFL